MTSNDDYILEILEEVGLLTHDQTVEARDMATQEDMAVIDWLDREKVLDKRTALTALAHQFGMESLILTGHEIERDVLDLVPGEVCQRYKIVPVYKNGNTLTVAIGDPLDVDTLDSLRYLLKCNVEGVVALPEEIGRPSRTTTAARRARWWGSSMRCRTRRGRSRRRCSSSWCRTRRCRSPTRRSSSW